MSQTSLTEEEVAILGQCLHAAAEGPFFPEWEFQTLIGSSRDEIRRLAARWPLHEADDSRAVDAVIGVLSNLVGYPHGREAAWSSFIEVGPAEVSAVLEKIIRQQALEE